MLKNFREFIDEKQLFTTEQRLLVAVSGGIDSVVLCDLLHKAGYKFAVAHCNFQLRGADSDGDEAFVRTLAEQYGAPFFVSHFQTQAHADAQKVSIQMAARELRYVWFDALLAEQHFDWLLTAHHQNDVIETVLLNLTKGTGIAGIRGILPKKGHLVRPLWFAAKTDLTAYATQQGLLWREDVSNASDKYQRNLLRHHVVPILQQINPNLENTFAESMEKMRATAHIFEAHLRRFKTDALEQKGTDRWINIARLQQEPEPALVLFETLRQFGFNYPTVRNICRSLDHEPGSLFESGTHILLKDRTHLILSEKSEMAVPLHSPYFITADQGLISLPTFEIRITDSLATGFSLPTSPIHAALDADKLNFPLQVRLWQAGDAFQPLGMKKGRKKISDFLNDLKIPYTQKQKVYVLTQKDEIIWVIGYRISQRFRISNDTQKIKLFALQMLS